ncbi:unnamed protein product [Closterium sp. NIES-64]|nr:unnamed protein product [Closterium sp. Naga37s-1]CAI5969717.1 unnamed protein product [Closterium sp. NIES-64]
MADSMMSEVAPAIEPSPVKARPFGRTKSVSELLGGGKVADTLLWKDWKSSSAILLSVVALWFFFERSGMTLLTLAADGLMIVVTTFFLWAQVASFLNKSGPPLPELKVSEDSISKSAIYIRDEINTMLKLAHDVALGKDYLLFAKVLAALYVVAVVGAWFHFLTLVLIAIVTAFSLPALYDKFEDQVDEHLEKVLAEMDKIYKLAEEKIRGALNKPKSKKTE